LPLQNKENKFVSDKIKQKLFLCSIKQYAAKKQGGVQMQHRTLLTSALDEVEW
jgi:hypothetical protein